MHLTSLTSGQIHTIALDLVGSALLLKCMLSGSKPGRFTEDALLRFLDVSSYVIISCIIQKVIYDKQKISMHQAMPQLRGSRAYLSAHGVVGCLEFPSDCGTA